MVETTTCSCDTNGQAKTGSEMATVKDVAKLAGVSVGTVSKVLSQDSTVKQVRRDKVLKAVKDLGYKPNQAARALRTKKANVIGLVVPDITNPFFAKLAMSIEKEASTRGYTVMLTTTLDDPETEERQISALLEQSLHGLVVVATNDSSRASLGNSDIPIVSLDRRFGAAGLVSIDHSASAAKAAEYLLELGHRRIAYFAGPQDTEVGRLRKHGFVEAVEKFVSSGDHVTLDVLEGTFDYDSGEALAHQVLSGSDAKAPSAIATGNDQMAIGALRTANDLGLNVPKDLSVVGFDDIDLALHVVPRLTTISQPTSALCSTAVTKLLGALANPRQDELIEGSMIIRGSTAPPK